MAGRLGPGYALFYVLAYESEAEEAPMHAKTSLIRIIGGIYECR